MRNHKHFRITEHYLDEDGTITFFLDPPAELLCLVSEKDLQRLLDPEDEASGEFYSVFNAGNGKWSHSVILHRIGKDWDTCDRSLDLPPVLERELVASIKAYCESKTGETFESLCARHLAECAPEPFAHP